MVSDGELRQMIREGERLGYSTIVEALVELQAYRQAFSEPVASVYFDSYYGYQASFANPTKLNNGEFLYRKSTIPE
ncbi:hypothetical protein ACTUSR_08225 [Pantoea stewartii subsp. indologenes]|uniref:hypothetical protein n=1 Tax=Pantoea stewartii TaxID=66269 RepID=UPI003FA478CF